MSGQPAGADTAGEWLKAGLTFADRWAGCARPLWTLNASTPPPQGAGYPQPLYGIKKQYHLQVLQRYPTPATGLQQTYKNTLPDAQKQPAEHPEKGLVKVYLGAGTAHDCGEKKIKLQRENAP